MHAYYYSYVVIDEQEADQTSPLTHKELVLISQHITNWQELAKKLNLSDNEIYNVLQQYTRNTSEQCVNMLYYWLAQYEISKRNPTEQSPKSFLASTLRKQGYHGLADVLEAGYVLLISLYFVVNGR